VISRSVNDSGVRKRANNAGTEDRMPSSEASVIDCRERRYSNYYSTQVNVGAADAEKLARTNLPWARRLIRRNIPVDRGIRLVDLGCGYGRLLFGLKLMGYNNCMGIDGSESQLSVGRQLGLERLFLDDVQTFLRDTPDQSFDVVTAIDLLEHLEKSELIKTLDQILRILRPNGSFVLHVPNAEGILAIVYATMI
jgi:2-polyprenyl-3-methyl-5-hydroxy-6-metoxy-1,4-benzoquinol methylase